jgi:uncharacterized membrane protein
MIHLLSLDAVYALCGLLLLLFAVGTLRDRQHPRRYGSALFWALLGLIFLWGGLWPHWLTGLLVLVLVAIDGMGRVTRGSQATSPDVPVGGKSPGPRIFWPVLAIPAMTFLLALLFRWGGLDANRGAIVGLGLGGVVAMAIALRVTGGSVGAILLEGRRLNEAMGAVTIMPQLLASLGVIFTAARVGDLIAAGVRHVVPADHLFLLVLVNCLGMTLLTILMGNSFAAFPVIASGVLIPLLVVPFGVDPATAAILTLTAGSSGTLMTPMAANFNTVPAALLDLRDPYGVIRFQLPVAGALWAFHVLWMWLVL